MLLRMWTDRSEGARRAPLDRACRPCEPVGAVQVALPARLLLMTAALLLPASAISAAPAAEGLLVTVCTSAGPVEVLLDEDGKPHKPARRDTGGCAHLWCDARRKSGNAKAGA